LQRSTYSPGFGEYAVNRIVNGANQIYLIYFWPDANGIWRIDSM